MAHSILPRIRLLGLLSLLAITITALHSITVSVPADPALADYPECADGIDNDYDGYIDYPEDAECFSSQDDAEGPVGRGVFVTLSDGAETVRAGGSLTYTITLNTERDDREEVDVVFQMPHQANLISATDGGRQVDDTIRWSDVSIYSGVTRKLYVNVNITPYAQEDLLLVAHITAAGQEDTDTTKVVEAPAIQNTAMQITVSDGANYVEPGEILEYLITVRNPYNEDKEFNLRAQVPSETTVVNYPGGDRVVRRTIEWDSQKIGPKQTREFTFAVRVIEHTPEFTTLKTRASINEVSAVDTTSVHIGAAPTAFEISVSDGLTSAAPGSEVTFDIVIKNNSSKLATEVDVNNALPQYMEYVSSTEGGQWIGKNVRWTGLTVSPYGQRVLQVTGRVRSDAPLGSRLKNTVLALGYEAVDITEIGTTFAGDRITQTGRDVFVRKTADRSEVQPGDVVNYTVTIRNTTNKPLSNLHVVDRMDSEFVTILNAEYGQNMGNAIMWDIPQLASGQEWTVRYGVEISTRAPHGVTIPNIVTVSGEGMDTVSLTERIYTMELNVIRSLPPTGAAFDAIFLALTGLIGAAQTLVSRRKLL